MTNQESARESELLKTLKDSGGKLMRRVWPTEGGADSLQQALTEVGENELFESLMRHLQLMDSTLPVVAVLGLLNAGKSSTVGTFLSAAGRRRVLRGLASHEATQRFVLWCPSSWERDEVRSSLHDVLTTVFGAKLEYLQEDAQAAHQQYNADSGDVFDIPLLAFDEGLNEAGFAILDCPDVERKYPGAEGFDTCNLRLEVLKKASSIASALLVVASHDGSAKAELEKIVHSVLQQMPGIQWWMLLNKCDVRYMPDEVYHLTEQMATRLKAQGVYVAYNFMYDQELWRKMTPVQVHAFGEGHFNVRQPAFYLVDPDPDNNPPNAVDDERLLSHLSKSLQGEDGLGQRLRSIHALRLGEEIQKAQTLLTRYGAESEREIRALWEKLLAVCTSGYMDSNGQLVVPLTPDAAASLQKAFVDTAPFSTRVALKASLGIGRALGWVKAGPEWVLDRFNQWLGKEGAGDSARVAAKINACTFVDKMVNEAFALAEVPEGDRLRVWNEILSRHQSYRPDQLEEEELNTAMKEVWSSSGQGVKVLGFAGPMVLVLILIAFAMAATDGGVTLVAVLTKLGVPAAFTLNTVGAALAYQIVGFLSISEILIALGATAALAPLGGYMLESMMRKRLALPALSNLFACACDAFGLPRRVGKAPQVTLSGQTHSLPTAVAECGNVVHQVCKKSLWKVKPEGWRRLHKEVQSLAEKPEPSSHNS